MATRRDEAICLRQLDWSETSQVVTLLGRQIGLVRALVKGARRERAPYSGGLEVLTRGEMVAIIKASGAMATLTSWDLLDPMNQLRRSLGAHYGAIYLADATQRSLSELDPHPPLYDALVAALGALGDEDAAPVCLRYLWTLLAQIGYRPDLGDPGAASIVGFDPEAGRLVARGGAGSWPVRAATIRALRALDAGAAADHATTARALRLLDAYLTRLLGRPLPSAEAFFGAGGPGAAPR
ncbi:MAG: DNA repair protein RecO [Phycisphaerales bacterium JB039]